MFIVWHRRDLRIKDNAALFFALQKTPRVIPVFILDTTILQRSALSAFQLRFMSESLQELKKNYETIGLKFILRKGNITEELENVVRETNAKGIYFNEDYEVYARKRDESVKKHFRHLSVLSFKDHVLFSGNDVLSNQGTPYTVFTPYKKKWLSYSDRITPPFEISFSSKESIAKVDSLPIPDFELPKNEGVKKIFIGGETSAQKTLDTFIKNGISSYDQHRNFPSFPYSTSKLSPHLRLGTISIRSVYFRAIQALSENPDYQTGIDTFISELIWRDFFSQILCHFPFVEKESFVEKRRSIKWENNHKLLEAWKEGRTGFPIIDAGMRELNQTGWMHNRLRMITASFLTKTLLIDWKIGEDYFMQKLIDGDIASNNGGWQWSASTGADTKPLRIFNPFLQSQRYDKSATYIKKFVPELKDAPLNFIHQPTEATLFEQKKLYPPPIVDFHSNRRKALKLYATKPLKDRDDPS